MRWLLAFILLVASDYYLPIMWVRVGEVEGAALRRQFVELWLNHPGQGRVGAVEDGRLRDVAQRHADELCYRELVLHEPHGYDLHVGLDGLTPNERVLRSGYRLPAGLAVRGNYFESIAVTHQGAEYALSILVNSPGHVDHVVGRVDFFAEQTRYGVGVACGRWFVLVTAPPEEVTE